MSTTSGDIGRYFLHGIVFSIIMTFVLIGWALVLVFLVAFGSIIGLVIGFALLFVFMGAVNSSVAGALWDLKMKSSLSDYLVQGFLLFVLLVIVSIPVNIISDLLIPTYDLSSLVIKTIVMTIVMAFIDGYLARAVAGSFQM